MLRQKQAKRVAKPVAAKQHKIKAKKAMKKAPKQAMKLQKRNFSAAADGEYDLVVIGGGPGGYVGAIKAAQLGLKVANVEMRGTLGGTCLNVGCIPSKALLNASHHYESAKKHFAALGIEGGENVSMNHEKMMANKDKVVAGLTGGIAHLFKKYKVDYVIGKGKITDKNTVTVDLMEKGQSTGQTKALKTKNIMIATGSEASVIPGVQIDEERVLTSTGALSLKAVPKRMTVIGAGVIGLELGSVYARLGSEVTVLGNADKIALGVDSEISTVFKKALEKQGLKFKLGQNVKSVVRKGDVVETAIVDAKSGAEAVVEGDVCLLATGRKPYTAGLGLEEMGIEMDRLQIKTNDKYQTNIPNIYAIGDVIAGPMLAHKAEEEGVFVAETLAGGHGHVDYASIPGVIYTHPEVATVGKSEDDLKAAGVDYKVGKFPFMANSRARANNDSEGLIKIMTDAKTDKVLGAHMVGPMVGELIQETAMAIAFGASAEDIARTCHAHPNLNEAVKEAAMAAAFGKPIHM
eukprot:UN00077